jgi:hypothetical protein
MLAGVFQPTPKYCQQSSVTSPLPAKASEIDFFKISTVAYKLLSRKKNHETFTTSLDELDFLLTDCQAIDQVALVTLSKINYSPDEHLVDKCLAKFPQYASFRDVCNKRALDQLLLRYTAVDHKIELTQANNLSYSPLYQMTTKELFAVKEYLLKNLHKGFIVPSSSSFACPVLFVAKPNSSLRFCVNYRKLNSLTKKDQHLLPLINETLA